MHRVRLRDEDGDVPSDEDFNDEGLHIHHDYLEEALKARVGGHEDAQEMNADATRDGKGTHEDHSRSGMEIAHAVWKCNVDPTTARNTP